MLTIDRNNLLYFILKENHRRTKQILFRNALIVEDGSSVSANNFRRYSYPLCAIIIQRKRDYSKICNTIDGENFARVMFLSIHTTHDVNAHLHAIFVLCVCMCVHLKSMTIERLRDTYCKRSWSLNLQTHRQSDA